MEMVAWQEELDWTVYSAFKLPGAGDPGPLNEIEPVAPEHRPFAIRLARKADTGEATHYWFEAMETTPTTEVPGHYRSETQQRIRERLALIESNGELSLLESPEYKRKWEPIHFRIDLEEDAFEWLAHRVEKSLQERTKPITLSRIVGTIQDDDRFLALTAIYQNRRDFDLTRLITEILTAGTVPNHPHHIYTESGFAKRGAWEETWALQRREDAGKDIGEILVPPAYSQGSRGKSKDFLRTEYWKLRGKLDVPKERFIAFTEVPGRTEGDTLYGWAGWTPLQRIRVLLALDEDLEDAGVPVADRVGVLDSAWRLLHDAAREDPKAAGRLKAELQALVGPKGPSREMLEDWRERFPPPRTRRKRKPRKKRA